MGYTREKIIEKCEKAFCDIKTFYKKDFINYGGRTPDTDEYYTEVIAGFLIERIAQYVKGIPEITRESTYKTPTHDGMYDEIRPVRKKKLQWKCLISQKKVRAIIL